MTSPVFVRQHGWLEALGHECEVANSAEALKYLHRDGFDVAFLDLKLGEESGRHGTGIFDRGLGAKIYIGPEGCLGVVKV